MPRKCFRYTRIDGISRHSSKANQKLGFKDYQLRGKGSIKRFMQLAFAIWTGILLVEMLRALGQAQKTLEEIDHFKHDSFKL